MKRKQNPSTIREDDSATDESDSSFDDDDHHSTNNNIRVMQKQPSSRETKKKKTTRSSSNTIGEIKNGNTIVRKVNLDTESEQSLSLYANNQSLHSETSYRPLLFYAPQLNDDVVFIREGYKAYMEQIKEDISTLTFIIPVFENIPNVDQFPPSINCTVSQVEFKSIVLKENIRITLFTLTLTKKTIMNEEVLEGSYSSFHTGDTFKIDLIESSFCKPFIITLQHYQCAARYFKTLKIGQVVKLDFFEHSEFVAYDGTIASIEPISLKEPKCMYEAIKVQWPEESALDKISVWELKDIEEKTPFMSTLPHISNAVNKKLTLTLSEFTKHPSHRSLPYLTKSPYPMLFTTLLERLLKGFYRNSNAFLFDFKHVVECVKRETSSKNSTAVKQMMKTALVIEEIVKSESVGSVPSQLQSHPLQSHPLQSQHTSAASTTTVASSMDDSVNTTTTTTRRTGSSSSGIGSTGTGSTGTTIPPSSVLSGGGITTTIPVKPSTKTSATTTTTGTTASAPPLLDSTKLDVSKKKAKTTTSHKDMKELAQPSSVQTNTTTSTTSTHTTTTTLTTNTPKKQVHKMAEKSPKKKSTESSLITISGMNEEKSTIGGGTIQKEMKSKQQGGTPVETAISLQQPHALNNIARPMSTTMKDDEETDSSDEEMTLKLSMSSNSSNTSTRHTTMSVPLLNTSALSHNNNNSSSSTSSNSSSITNTTTGNVDTTKTINDHIQSYLGTSQNYLPDIPKIASKKQEMIGNTRKQEMIGNTSMMTNIPTMSDMTTASTTTNTIQPPPPPLHSLKDLPTIQKKKSTTGSEESQKTKHEETTLEKKKKKSQKKKHEESQDKKKKKTISTSTTTTTSTNNAEPFKIKIKLDNEPTPSAAYSSTSGVLQPPQPQPPLPTTMLDPTTTTTAAALSSLTAPATTQLPDTSSMKIPKKKEFTCTTDVVSTPGQWDSKSNNITLENHETIPPQVDISQTKPLDTMMDVGHGFTEDGFLTTETATTESTVPSTRVKSTMEPTTSHRITIPPITLKKKNHVKQYLESSCFSENRDDESTAIVTDDTENVYHEIIVKLTPIENGSKIKVQLESNPKFDQTQAEKRREWCKLLENNFKNIGTTTSQQIMSQIYGSSKRMNKTSTSSAAYSSLMDLSLPIFTTHKEFIIYRDEIPTIDFIPKSLFERQKDIYLYQQRHSLRIENIKTSITHLQIHVIREESQFMDTDEYNDRICNKISINIQCSMTEPERIQFYSLFDKVSEARAICKNTKLLFAHPQPHTLFELCDKFGFLVDDVFDWFVEGFYFKRRVGRNPNLVSPNAKYLILDFVYLHDCTEVELNTQ